MAGFLSFCISVYTVREISKRRLRHRRHDKGLEYDLRDKIAIKVFMVDPEPRGKSLLGEQEEADFLDPVCKACGQRNQPDTVFCINCGAKMDGVQLPD